MSIFKLLNIFTFFYAFVIVSLMFDNSFHTICMCAIHLLIELCKDILKKNFSYMKNTSNPNHSEVVCESSLSTFLFSLSLLYLYYNTLK